MKNIILSTVVAIAITSLVDVCYSKDYMFLNTVAGNSNTKGDAAASALLQLPYGARIQKVEINGNSVKECVPGIGYLQTQGSYKCRIYYTNP